MLTPLRTIILLMATLAALSGQGLAYTNSLPNSQAPHALLQDEGYLRDGAVTSMATCLAVANDKDAFDLWESDLLARARSLKDHDLAVYVSKPNLRVRYEPGFGTIYVCAKIVGAWYIHSGFLRPPMDDGSLQHGTLVIDLEFLEGSNRGRGTIAAVPLVRILTTPSLLPKSVFGGIVIRRARIEGTLLFHNIQLSMPLAFVDVEFYGSSYSKFVFGREKPITDTALAIAFSRFDGGLLIAHSKIYGHVRISDSRFGESLLFEDIEQRNANRSLINFSGEPVASPPFMLVQTSNFAQSLKILRSTFGQLKIIGNDINSFISAKSYFGYELRVVENDIESLQINCSVLAKKATLSYNLIQKDLFIDGDAIRVDRIDDRNEVDRTCHDWWHAGIRLASDHKTEIEIASNRIGGGLGLSAFAPATLAPGIRMASNRVGNGSQISLPAPYADGTPWSERTPWKGRVDLQGSTYEGTISISLDQSMLPPPPINKRERGSEVYCLPISETDHKGATVELRAARIRTLVWNLPLICDYRWLGYGFTYDLWLPGPNASRTIAHHQEKSEAKDRLTFFAWRRTLGEYQSASLNAMSSYLSIKGAYVDSRDLLFEAKRLNYAPRCRPDKGLFGCMTGVLTGFASHPPGTAWASEQTNPVEEETYKAADSDRYPLERGLDAVMVFLLAPGGYGAKPEQALVWILVAAIISFSVYAAYSFYLRWPLSRVPSLKSLLGSEGVHPNAPNGNPAGSGKGDQSGITQHDTDAKEQNDVQTLLDDLVSHWPSDLEWKDWDIQQRLHRIQSILLPRIEACEKEASEPLLAMLRSLRKKLERFGSTETLGFSLFDGGKRPTRFTHWRYSIDTMVPFIDLHAYSNYYPESGWMRFASVSQHVIGWWLMTVFIASAAIL